MFIVVKEVGRESIHMESMTRKGETKTAKFLVYTGIAFAFVFIFSSLVELSLYVVVFSFLMFAVFSGVVIIGKVGIENYPVFRLYIQGRDVEIFVPRTGDHEKDQMGICYAIRTLEVKAREFNKELNELEEFALGCK